jgi:hypothetical protein
MRRLAAVAALLLAACAPRPCTRALCPLPGPASYRVTGWSGSVTVSPGDARVPVVSDSSVETLSGEARFRNGKAEVSAPAGAAFRFELAAPPAPPAGVLTVSSGTLTVRLSSAAAAETVPAGSAFFLPVAK